MANITHNGDPNIGEDTQASATMQQQIDSLSDALVNRQQIGWVTGLISGSLGLTAQESWHLLAKLSQHTNIKVHRIASLIESIRAGGEPTATDLLQAERLRAVLGTDWDRLMVLDIGRPAIIRTSSRRRSSHRRGALA